MCRKKVRQGEEASKVLKVCPNKLNYVHVITK